MQSERQTVLHSWCRQIDWNAPTIVGGEGARLFTADGRTILDMSSLSECSNLGHQHPHVVAAIREQAEKLCFVTNAWGAEPRARLAEQLLEKSGFEGGRVFFTLGGADANEHAVKFARQASGKAQGWIVSRDRSYHGASYAAMALSGDARTAAQVNAGAHHVVHAPPAYPYRCPFDADSPEACGLAASHHVGALIDGMGAELVAFPELVLTGYPPEDLLLRPEFIDQNMAALDEVARATKGITAIVGFAQRAEDVYNAAAIVHDEVAVRDATEQRHGIDAPEPEVELRHAIDQRIAAIYSHASPPALLGAGWQPLRSGDRP